jgi:hypothetical protein
VVGILESDRSGCIPMLRPPFTRALFGLSCNQKKYVSDFEIWVLV